MRTIDDMAADILNAVAGRPARGRRRLIALAGAPGSGKSTLAEAVAAQLPHAVVMPMDGFHLDDRLLEPAGLLPRKGAPETFDRGGFAATVARVATEEVVYLPVFDRAREIAIAGASRIGPETETVVVEGNYLCLDEEGWRDLGALWDVSVFLDVPVEELERRLIARWLGFGFDAARAREKALGNDIPNARRVAERRVETDVTVHWA
ncbi:nucleoside/nucleotide kinase family protein [Sagittula sp. S175]|uniref:nucleoside/nucleotide kinase family protein n=1 Tax=Sagittula sp. S175 TaxID=3415129 RepID=UPI003C7B3FCF